jgi:hypothetical protein
MNIFKGYYDKTLLNPHFSDTAGCDAGIHGITPA